METVRLKHIALVTGGQSPSSDDVSDFDHDGLPFLQGNAEFGLEHPTPKYRCDLAPRKAPAGSILLSVRAPVGAMNWANRDYGIGRGLCSIEPTGAPDRYVWWALQATVSALRSEATGSTFEAVAVEDVAGVALPTHGERTQKRIADFLDGETARIDGLVAAKQQMIQLLDERRWLVLASEIAETDCPAVPLRRVLLGITDGPFGSAFSSSEYSDDGVAVVRLGNIGFAEWRSGELVHLPASRFDEFHRHRVSPGDLLIAGLGDARNHAGRACVAPNLGPAIVKGKCFCARVDPARAVADYLAMFCSSPAGADAISVEARGSTRSMINLDIMKAMEVPLPDLSRQVEIVGRVRSAWRLNSRIRETLVRQLELLRERRQAMIAAAVTGELVV